jgi:hypothetical protein
MLSQVKENVSRCWQMDIFGEMYVPHEALFASQKTPTNGGNIVS